MPYVLRLVDTVGKVEGPCDPLPKAGAFVKSYNPDAHGGRGEARWTTEVDAAMKFETPVDAMAFYRRVSKVRPVREDGRPNRPLTCFTMTIEAVK